MPKFFIICFELLGEVLFFWLIVSAILGAEGIQIWVVSLAWFLACFYSLLLIGDHFFPDKNEEDDNTLSLPLWVYNLFGVINLLILFNSGWYLTGSAVLIYMVANHLIFKSRSS